ncbi:hypothetical protein Avbf_03509 [Armadillidium vulgare]|nr:hypothetical protein Avbf_03509 [Armadillidium vulgare]
MCARGLIDVFRPYQEYTRGFLAIVYPVKCAREFRLFKVERFNCSLQTISNIHHRFESNLPPCQHDENFIAHY